MGEAGQVPAAGLVLDFDGLIIDSESACLTAWREEYARYGLSLDLDQWVAAVGTHDPSVDDYGVLGGLVGPSFDRSACERRHQARERELVDACELLPGVAGWLDEADELGVPCAVASSSTRAWVVPRLDRLGIADRFTAVICREDVGRVKPAPDLHLAAAAALGVPARRCVAAEDSVNGVVAAISAGCLCVLVPNPVTAGQRCDLPVLRASSLLELRLADMLTRLSPQSGTNRADPAHRE
jgi:putative hydrolase of the HAD superfamily